MQFLLLKNILDLAKLSGDSYLRKLTTNHTRPVFENHSIIVILLDNWLRNLKKYNY